MKLILASGSPRRSEILKNAGYEFVVKPTSADESLPGGILPEDAVKLLSERKADAAEIECSDVVLSADTVVALGDRILGKPSDKTEAFSMLRSLSGKTHSVYTGVTIKSAEKKRVFAVKTDVLFYPLTDDEINAYIATGEPFDKAGAYGIQGRAAVFVEKSTVIITAWWACRFQDAQESCATSALCRACDFKQTITTAVRKIGNPKRETAVFIAKNSRAMFFHRTGALLLYCFIRRCVIETAAECCFRLEERKWPSLSRRSILRS